MLVLQQLFTFLRPAVPLVHWAPQYSQKTQYGIQYLNFDIYIGMEKVIKRLESFNLFSSSF
jgi:hypothetical protein